MLQLLLMKRKRSRMEEEDAISSLASLDKKVDKCGLFKQQDAIAV